MNDLHKMRVQAALSHRESDRFPITIGGPSSSLHKGAQSNLLQFLQISPVHPQRVTDRILQIVEPEEQLLDQFDIDLCWLLPHEAPVDWSEDGNEYTDEFGRKFIRGGGFFNQVGKPFTKLTSSEINTYVFPDLKLYNRFVHFEYQANQLSNKGIAIGIDGPWGIYEISSSLVGVEDYLMGMILNPDYVRNVAEKVLEFHHIPFYKKLLSATSLQVEIIGISDDVGSQNGMLFSRKIFQRIFKPLYKELIEFIRTLTSAKIYMHSDGSIAPIIPDLIEIGVDGINPVQYTAKDMGLLKLKNEFGKYLGFFGGVIDNDTLSFGSPDMIREIIRQNVKILKKDGGFIFAPIHNISQEVPPENIIALYQSGIEFLEK